ncbi:MAG: 4Fe-4S dicluster domain-containing protein [Candidatus Altiarchaeales archaeon]|nr:4Fe-4S dicluster domain-containing protein [Candidatus Altiarchaeales archaeon]MBD3416416.1 4Fe-4S dicluster domain-containing protein [Candidatus Altiarchaeales archaeon]
MVKRSIIEIDEDKCTGCGLCIPNCPEGALQMIDGKARLVSDLFCDGLGACMGHCPEGAIDIVEREAEPYDERRVMENIVKQGYNTIKAHLEHLRDHGEMGYYNEAVGFLKDKGLEVPETAAPETPCSGSAGGCPGARTMDFSHDPEVVGKVVGEVSSQLRQWPVQMHLVSPLAPYFKGADVLLSADCAAYSYGRFHGEYLKGRRLAIACPKLDSEQQTYVEKLVSLIDDAGINTLTVVTMEVPCCTGLLQMAKEAVERAQRKVPVKSAVISIKGEKLREEWV